MMEQRFEAIDGWKSIREDPIWDSEEGEMRIMSILKMSFDELKSSSLKQCFAYCSMFNKDFQMQKDDLIQLWMAQGFLYPSPNDRSPNKSIPEMEEIGEQRFNHLLKSSLFQDVTKDEYNNITLCKMHDLVHDLAERVSSKNKDSKIWHKKISTLELEETPKEYVQNLRSVFLKGKVVGNILQNFKRLRVLDFFEAKMSELPSSIGQLKHLRYLMISQTWITSLPRSIGKFYNLQTLRMKGLRLREFPKELQNLINLRHVYFEESRQKFPVGIGRLTKLRTLSHFVVDKEKGRGIEELAELEHLTGRLYIYGLEHVKDGEEAKKAKLAEKKNLRRLIFDWQGQSSIASDHEEVLKGLQPHSYLEFLEIRCYQGDKFPSWMTSPGSFLALKRLSIQNSSDIIEWVEAATLPKKEEKVLFPRLEELSLWCCSQLRSTPSHFPSLKKLEISYMDSAMAIENISKRLTSLTSLTLSNIKGLDSLPEGLLRNNKNLACLEIMECRELATIAPDVFGCCANLESLFISMCSTLTHLPDGLHTLGSLKKLVMAYCPSIEFVPHTEGLANSPQQFCNSLEVLRTDSCSKITSIPITHSGLTSLRELQIQSCPELPSLPSGLQYCTSLEDLDISYCDKLKSTWIHGPPSLYSLKIFRCSDLKSINLHGCTSLRHLDIFDCESLKHWPDALPMSASIEKLSIRDCHNLETTPSLENLINLRELVIRECHGLKSLHRGLAASHCFVHLKKMELGEFCSVLDSFPAFQIMPQLEELELSGWPKLKSLPEHIQHFTSLTSFVILCFDEMETLPEWLGNLASLEYLAISHCEKVKYLPSAEAMRRLRLDEICVTSCPLLEERCEPNSGPEWHKISHIPNYSDLRYYRG